jgi:hypothetical protein
MKEARDVTNADNRRKMIFSPSFEIMFRDGPGPEGEGRFDESKGESESPISLLDINEYSEKNAAVCATSFARFPNISLRAMKSARSHRPALGRLPKERQRQPRPSDVTLPSTFSLSSHRSERDLLHATGMPCQCYYRTRQELRIPCFHYGSIGPFLELRYQLYL